MSGTSSIDPTDAPIGVLVAEDEEPLRDALCELIRGELGFELVGAAADAQEAIDLARELQPPIALVDVKMPLGSLQTAPGGGGQDGRA